MNLFKKILIPTVAGLFFLGLISLLLSISALSKRGQAEIKAIQDTMMTEKQAKLKNLVELAYRTIENVNRQSDLTEAERQKQAMDLVKAMRYNKNDYLWINDTQPVMIMHPIKPALDGQNLWDFKDPNGKRLFVEFVKVCQQKGEGVVDYLWPKPGFDKPVPKLSYVKLFKPWGWVIGTGIYIEDVQAAVSAKEHEIRSAISHQRMVLIGLILVLMGISVGTVTWVARKAIHPIRDAGAMLKDIAEGEGDLTRRLKVDSKDEIGEMAHWFNLFVENLQHMIGSIAQQAIQLNNSASTLAQISQQLAGGAEQTSGKSNMVAAAAEQLNGNISSGAAAMEQTATNISMISAAVEEMSSTINEIARNSGNGSNIVSQAVSQAQSTSLKVEELGRAAQEIGKVTEAITEISEQTNLLALNATIEAARAGEAGKGFAVVANEIKELARQTASATEEIKAKISGIQLTTGETVTEITQISKVINDINEIVTTIATAVEEQSVTTKEIAGNVTSASQGVQDVNQNVAEGAKVSGDIAHEIAEVNQAASDIANGSSQVNISADEMTRLAEALNQLVGRFKV